MPEKEELILVHRYLSGQMEDLEKQRFEHRMVHEPALALLKDETAVLWVASAQYTAPQFDSRKGYELFQRNLRRRNTGRRVWIASVAAAILLIVVAGGLYFLNINRPTYTDLIASTPVEQTLPDGSRLELHQGAHIRIPDSFGKSKRRLEIVTGDVFFDIAPDVKRPFIITHPWAEVKVVGTEFMISIDTVAHNYLVLVTEGKVTFTPNLSKKEIAVSAGSGWKFNAVTRIIEPIRKIDENALSWQTGVLTFIDRPVNKVISDLETHYKIKIELVDSSAEDCLFTAPLPYRDVPVTVILDAVSTAFGMTLKAVTPQHYILSDGMCSVGNE